MVITLGTPNTGTFWSDAGETGRKTLCWEQTYNSQNVHLPSDFCKSWTALAGMSAFGPKIGLLPELPAAIPLYAIAGNEIFHGQIGFAATDILFDGDGVVSLSSALHHRSGGGTTSYTTIQNPPSAWHGDLPKNRDIIAMVGDLIRTYIATHPAPAPALGGDFYWLANGGQWTVHDSQLQISRGPSGLVGDESWNAYGAVVTGHAQLAFTGNADGSLTGTYTTSTTYTYAQGTAGDYPEFTPDSAAPRAGQTVTLTPIAPMYAKSVPGGSSPAAYGLGNPYLCQSGLAPNLIRNCGA
jgi:hypothetical protein